MWDSLQNNCSGGDWHLTGAIARSLSWYMVSLNRAVRNLSTWCSQIQFNVSIIPVVQISRLTFAEFFTEYSRAMWQALLWVLVLGISSVVLLLQDFASNSGKSCILLTNIYVHKIELTSVFRELISMTREMNVIILIIFGERCNQDYSRILMGCLEKRACLRAISDWVWSAQNLIHNG